ncbi:LPXTG cell wall anchor domain-containing protein [Rothia nasimurium]|uniref:LPXTG cell wall anchor domain-containing protein n=1 Tax=Rothia nasimurium TaxID=85336 RepID=UPI001F03246C|nr:LPXTG cell wall anchor domain-containing protein [Rothia nasimurium]
MAVTLLVGHALSPDGMVEQAVFAVGLGATVDCGQDAGGQRAEQLVGEVPGESQDGERLAGSLLGGGLGRQFLARTGASDLVAVGLGASLVLAGGALLMGVRRRFR